MQEEKKIYLKHYNPNYDKINAGTIYFRDEINLDSILYLIDLMESAFFYYQYNELQIYIESPGGMVVAADLIIDKFKEFQDKNKIISTSAFIQTSSAAAIMLTAGNIGKRGVKKNSLVLYHKTRFTEAKDITVSKLDEIKKNLTKTNKKMIDFMAEQGLKTLDYIFKKNYLNLQPKKSHLVEKYVDDFFGVINEKKIDLNNNQNKKDLKSLKEEYLDKFKNYFDFIKIKKGNSDIKENSDLVESIKEIFINTYDALTEYDIFLNPEEAKSLFLIDTIIWNIRIYFKR